MSESLPHIVVVDDEPDRLRHLSIELAPHARTTIVHPDDVHDEALQTANLVLVDYRLEDWPARDNAPGMALQPQNGLGLLAILRGHVEERLRRNAPTAFAIHSAHLEDLSPILPPQTRPHAIARSHNLEWAFAKAASGQLAVQITSLAQAVKALPGDWSLDVLNRNTSLARGLLNLPEDALWGVRAWENVEEAHAPIHELSQETHGLAFLRWLLHRILPYPCFLQNEFYLAARTRVSIPSLRNALGREGGISEALLPYRYTGILCDFLGPRWWRTGVEAFLWEATEGRSFDPEAILSVLNTLNGEPLEPTQATNPVVCLDANLQVLPDLYDSNEAIQIQPDDWPPYADRAWAVRSDVEEEPRLRGMMLLRESDEMFGDIPLSH